MHSFDGVAHIAPAADAAANYSQDMDNQGNNSNDDGGPKWQPIAILLALSEAFWVCPTTTALILTSAELVQAMVLRLAQ